MSLALDVPLGPTLSVEQAEAIYAQGKEAVVFALLEFAKQLAEQRGSSASTPSGMVPTYQKPSANTRRKTPGREAGHAGSRRVTPERIDEWKEHSLKCCPCCQGPVRNTNRVPRRRLVEDIPSGITPVVTEHTIPRYWCPNCRKEVEPQVPDALPNAQLGNNILTLSAWLHYGLGNTLSQVVEVFNHHLQIKLTPGGLIQMWYRLQAVLFTWYEQIQREALCSAVLHADETGWRVRGQTQWLWCFSNPQVTYYMINRSRGHPALAKFFIEEFAGILVSDFWGAYNFVECAGRQTCFVHLLRELVQVEKYQHPSPHWAVFAKKLRRLLGDAMRLGKNSTCTTDARASRRTWLDKRLQELIATDWNDPHAKRLIKRLRRHQGDLFTFLDHAGVPFDNNHAERAIRPAVIIRKNSYCNRSERGADTQAVLMSIYRTLKQRGHDPIQTIAQALRTFATTSKLPSLPTKAAASG